MKHTNRWMLALPIVSALTLVACTAKPPTAAKTDHAQVEKIDQNLKKVVLSAEAAKRLDIKTAPIRDEQVTHKRIVGGEIVALPASAIISAAPVAKDTSSATAAAEKFPTVLDERFAKKIVGWPDDPKATAWFDPDGLGYRLAPTTAGNFVAVGVPGHTDLTDVLVSATFRKTSGPSGGGYGLIVRDQQPGFRDGANQTGSYYVFEVSDRGEYGVWQRDGSRWIELLPWTTSEVVRSGGAENQLSVVALGESMTFLVNGTPVTTQTDTKLRSGGVGLYVAGDGDKFLIDRLTVRAPRASSAPPAAATASRLVVRVPTTVADLDKIDRGQPSRVLPLIPNAMNSGVPAQPATVADSGKALHYVLDNSAANLSAGQRVRVEVSLNGSGAQRKVLPYSSVIYDLKGDAWAYTSPAPFTFVRDRINIDYVDGDLAVLSQGPASGTPVVTTGAAELFGTEAGVGH
jgi:hypothetical protein